MKPIVILLLAAGLLTAQQFKLSLDHLAAKSSDATDIALPGSMLQFASKFLDAKDPDESRVKKLIAGLEGIYVKSYEFKQEGAWTQADLDSIRTQLRAPQWTRIVGVKSTEEGSITELYVSNQDKKINGVAIVSAEPKEFTVVNIVGPVNLDELASLGGHFGIPKLTKSPEK